MKRETRLVRREQEESVEATHAVREQPLEFRSPEEAIQSDRQGIEVPGRVAERIEDSIAREAPRPPWWKRLLGR